MQRMGVAPVLLIYSVASLSQLCCMLLLLTDVLSCNFPADPDSGKETGVFAVMALVVRLVTHFMQQQDMACHSTDRLQPASTMQQHNQAANVIFE